MNEGDLEYARVTADTLAEFPKYRVVEKSESHFMMVIDLLLRILSFGQMTTFLTGYITTVGTTMYVPPDWEQRDPYSRATTLRHERVHMRQCRDMPLGLYLFAICYLFVPLPVVFTWRAQFEMEAYQETLQATAEYHGTPTIKTEAFKERILSQFLSSAYFWMWPFRRSLSDWYDEVVSVIETEVLVRDPNGKA